MTDHKYRLVIYTPDGLFSYGRWRSTYEMANRQLNRLLKQDPTLTIEIEVKP